MSLNEPSNGGYHFFKIDLQVVYEIHRNMVAVRIAVLSTDNLKGVQDRGHEAVSFRYEVF